MAISLPTQPPFAIHATVIHSTASTSLQFLPSTLIIVGSNGKISHVLPNQSHSPDSIRSVLSSLSLATLQFHILQWPKHFLIPGLIDTHVHAPQHSMRALGSARRMHILEWLDEITFPHESRFSDLEYATKVYSKAVAAGLNQGITTACYFASLHTEASKVLADVALQKRQRAFIGKCSMDNKDTNPEYYREASTEDGLDGTMEVIAHIKRIDPEGDLVRPILTPRFAISCTRDCLHGLGEIAKKEAYAYGGNGVLVQTHFCEAQQEVLTTLKMYPEFQSEVELYQHYGLLGSGSVLAHCTTVTEDEISQMQKLHVGVAHCPISNTTVGGGFMAAPIKKYLDLGIKVGLGTDSGGGYSGSLLDVMRLAVVVGNAREVASEGKDGRVGLEEVFWMGTRGGADVLGLGTEIGGFQVGKRFDAVVIDTDPRALNELGSHGVMTEVEQGETCERVLEKFIMTADDRNMPAVYVNGVRVK